MNLLGFIITFDLQKYFRAGISVFGIELNDYVRALNILMFGG